LPCDGLKDVPKLHCGFMGMEDFLMWVLWHFGVRHGFIPSTACASLARDLYFDEAMNT